MARWKITSSRQPGQEGAIAPGRTPLASACAAAWEAVLALPDGFLGDPVWWAFGWVGLLADIALGLMFPAALSGSVLHGAAQWLSCVLWQPVLEEVVFRWMLQGELLRTGWGSKRIGQISAANLLCSLGFTAMHFAHHPPLWAASVFVPSLIFGWLRERYDGVGAPIGMHVLYNLEFFTVAALFIA